MYLIIVFILILILGVYSYFCWTSKEGFNQNLVDVLPIQISNDNSTISVPNHINGNKGVDITFGGNIQAPTGTTDRIHASDYATLNNLTVNGDTNLNQVTIKGQTRIIGSNLFEFGADTGKSWDGNGSISYKTSWDGAALNIVGAENGGARKVHLWDDVEINNNLHVNGSIQLGNGANIWTIRARDNGWLEFLHNNTSPDDYGGDVGHVIMSPDGNLWLARSTYQGWVADNLQAINNKGV
jgi:hypothetical protein